jgi:hypothetical protein
MDVDSVIISLKETFIEFFCLINFAFLEFIELEQECL